MRTVGVEEEYLLVSADHARTTPVATEVLRIAAARGQTRDTAEHGSLVHELQEQQLEAYTTPQRTMSMLEDELTSWRCKAASAAAELGTLLVATATSPIAAESRHVRDPRYDRMAERFGITTREHLTCGCHVHVSVTSPAEAVGVLDRIRVWLPVLLALSANSPFWQGQDTGYASFRSQALSRWPVSGPIDILGTAENYRAFIDDLLAANVLLDEGMLYFDARCSRRYPTVEIRVPDVCSDVREAVMIAALCRALVATSAEEWAAGVPPPPVPTTLLKLATWHAARWGTSATLLDPLTSRPCPASDVIAALLDHVRPALCHADDLTMVTERIDTILVHGNGATRQREVFDKTGRLSEVIAMVAATTTRQCG